jgi:hypothetical protein
MMTPNGSYVKGLTSSSINFYVRGAPLKFKKNETNDTQTIVSGI